MNRDFDRLTLHVDHAPCTRKWFCIIRNFENIKINWFKINPVHETNAHKKCREK